MLSTSWRRGDLELPTLGHPSSPPRPSGPQARSAQVISYSRPASTHTQGKAGIYSMWLKAVFWDSSNVWNTLGSGVLKHKSTEFTGSRCTCESWWLGYLWYQCICAKRPQTVQASVSPSVVRTMWCVKICSKLQTSTKCLLLPMFCWTSDDLFKLGR